MKTIFVTTLILLPLLSLAQQQIEDTATQSIYYQKTLFNKSKFAVYGYTSYDLYWENESGIGIVYYIRGRNKKKLVKRK